jgi:hypothetical protein
MSDLDDYVQTTIESLKAALDSEREQVRQMKFVIGCLIYQAGGSITISDEALRSTPVEFELVRHRSDRLDGETFEIVRPANTADPG